MTVKDLIDDLSRFQDASQVVFTPREFCGSGYPEWNGASACAAPACYRITPAGIEAARQLRKDGE